VDSLGQVLEGYYFGSLGLGGKQGGLLGICWEFGRFCGTFGGMGVTVTVGLGILKRVCGCFVGGEAFDLGGIGKDFGG